MNYFIAPRSGEKSYKNFESTIKNGIPLERISKYLDKSEIDKLSKEEVIYAWGNRKGTYKAWKDMREGEDIVIFYANGKLVMTGEVYLKKESAELALAMWPPDENGNPWKYTFFIRNLKYISIPIEMYNATAGHKPNAFIQGFKRMKEEYRDRIVAQYGSVEAMLRLFSDKNSEEIPLETDRLYVNVPKTVTPLILNDVRLSPKIRAEILNRNKARARKVDYAARDKRNSITGSKGEELVVDVEKKKLCEASRPDLADKVIRVSLENDNLGYDILSFEPSGKERYIEVKTSTCSAKIMRFYVSCNEYETGASKDNYFIYFVENVNSESPKITIIEKPIDSSRFLIEPDGYVFEAQR